MDIQSRIGSVKRALRQKRKHRHFLTGLPTTGPTAQLAVTMTGADRSSDSPLLVTVITSPDHGCQRLSRMPTLTAKGHGINASKLISLPGQPPRFRAAWKEWRPKVSFHQKRRSPPSITNSFSAD